VWKSSISLAQKKLASSPQQGERIEVREKPSEIIVTLTLPLSRQRARGVI
jgi:hypothetical protein